MYYTYITNMYKNILLILLSACVVILLCIQNSKETLKRKNKNNNKKWWGPCFDSKDQLKEARKQVNKEYNRHKRCELIADLSADPTHKACHCTLQKDCIWDKTSTSKNNWGDTIQGVCRTRGDNSSNRRTLFDEQEPQYGRINFKKTIKQYNNALF